jgi:hypothetical protein
MTMEQSEQVDNTATPVADITAPEPQAQIPIDEDGALGQPDAPAPSEQPAEAPPPTLGTEALPQAPQYTPEQVEQLRQSNAQYQEMQQRAALQNQSDIYKGQLEAQGYLPEQAEQAANNYMQSQQQQQTLMQQAEAYGQHIQGKQLAAEHFVKKYNLGVEDFVALRQYEDPQSMEQGAKKLAADRERDNELAKFKQAQVPAQSFDNSQGNPQVAANEGSWLDRYNSGDRSPQAEAAAKRAAGLG